MIRILLVDDEPVAREHIREAIPWASWGFEIAGEAANGAEALAQCEAIRPDLALIDITMPVMDGMMLLERLGKEHPNVRSIILTAHRDFHYAQEAIRKGALGYILKSPVDLTEMKAALDRACKEIERDSTLKETQRSHTLLIRNYHYPLRRSFFDNIVTGGFSSTDEMHARAEALGINLHADLYLLIYCLTERLPQFQSRYPEKDWPLVEYAMVDIANEILQQSLPGMCELFPIAFGQFVILLRDPGASFHTYRPLVQQAADALQAALEKYLQIRLAFCVCEPFRRSERIAHMYLAAKRLLQHRFYLEQARPVFAEGLAPVQPERGGKLDALFEELANVIEPYSEVRFQSWCDKLKQHTVHYKPERTHVLDKLAALRSYPAWKPVAESADLLPWPDFLEAVNIHEAVDWFSAYVRRWDEIRERLVPVRPEVSAAIRYIKSQLTEDLTIQSIAEHIELSSSYLGHLFKKDLGISIVDYILMQRIQLAKQWIRSGKYRSYDLAEKAGFHSYSYFCRTFKKLVGMTPNEYKIAANSTMMLEDETE